MKKIYLLIITALSFSIPHSNGQGVSSLGENFDLTCASGGISYPLNWSEWNIIPPTTALAWSCTELGGRYGTPGIQCNSYFGGTHYIDTAWLFTPQLNLTGFTDSVYLRFDSRYTVSGARMQVLINNVYHPGSAPDSVGVPSTWIDMANRTTPVIGPDDSAGWVTHYVNLTSYKNTPLYVAFRYATGNTAGGIWTIDNVFLTPWGLNVDKEVKKSITLTVLGNSTTDKISFSGTFYDAGNYDVQIYDNLGRIVHNGSFYTNSGTSSHTLSHLGLHSGMYIVKVGNATSYQIVKAIVE